MKITESRFCPRAWTICLYGDIPGNSNLHNVKAHTNIAMSNGMSEQFHQLYVSQIDDRISRFRCTNPLPASAKGFEGWPDFEKLNHRFGAHKVEEVVRTYHLTQQCWYGLSRCGR